MSCLPKDLPEFLELDLSGMSLNDTKFLADIPLPPGVTIPELAHRNAPVVSIHAPARRGAGAGCRRGRRRCRRRRCSACCRRCRRPPPALRLLPASGDAKKGEEKKDAAPAKKEGGKK